MTLYFNFRNTANNKIYSCAIMHGTPITLVKTPSSPVRITHEADENVLSPVRTSTATIEVLTPNKKEFFFEMNATEPLDFPVLIQEHPTTEEGRRSVLWYGFLTPNRFDNDYTSAKDVVTFECRCGLSVLSDLPYISEEKKSLLMSQVLLKVFGRLQTHGGGYKVLHVQKTFNIKSPSKTQDFTTLRISEKNFFDKKEYDEQPDNEVAWTCKEVLEEICKWLNLSAVARGREIYLFDCEALKGGQNEFYTYSLEQFPEREPAYTLERLNIIESVEIRNELFGGSDNSISLDPVANSVKTKDNFYKVTALFEDAFDEGKLRDVTAPMGKFYPLYYQGGRNYETPNGSIINFALYGLYWNYPDERTGHATTGYYGTLHDARILGSKFGAGIRIKKATWFKFFDTTGASLYRYDLVGSVDGVVEYDKSVTPGDALPQTSLSVFTFPFRKSEVFDYYPGIKQPAPDARAIEQIGACIVREYSKKLDTDLDEYIKKANPNYNSFSGYYERYQPKADIYANSFNNLTPFLDFDEKILLVVGYLSQALKSPEDYRRFPCLSIKRNIPEELFIQNPYRYFRISGEFAMNNKPYDITFNDKGSDQSKNEEDKKDIGVEKIEREDLFIRARLEVGGLYWNGVYWDHQESDFKIYYGKQEGTKCEDIPYTWHALSGSGRVWGQGLKEEGYYIPMPPEPQGDKCEFIIYLPDGKFREGYKYKVSPEKQGELGNEIELTLAKAIGGSPWCYWLKNLKFELVDANPNYLEDTKSDTEYAYNASSSSTLKGESREFKICTDDGSVPNYSSVTYLGENRAEAVDKVFDFTTQTEIRQEELYIHKYLQQYRTPSVRLKLELRLNSINPFAVFSSVLHPGASFMPMGGEIDLERSTARIELRDIKGFSELLYNGNRYRVEKTDKARTETAPTTRTKALAEKGVLKLKT